MVLLNKNQLLSLILMGNKKCLKIWHHEIAYLKIVTNFNYAKILIEIVIPTYNPHLIVVIDSVA